MSLTRVAREFGEEQFTVIIGISPMTWLAMGQHLEEMGHYPEQKEEFLIKMLRLTHLEGEFL